MYEAHILVVEDEANLATLMHDYLSQEGHQVTINATGAGVLEQLRETRFDVVILDLMLPQANGIDLCREIRHFSSVPIIMTTAKVAEIDRILGLEIGANDYVCKPYSPRELVARVHVQLRLQQPTDPSPDALQLDVHQLVAKTAAATVELTAVEFNLLHKMYAQPGRVFSRDQLMDAVYSDGRIVADRTIDSHLKKLRHNLKELGAHECIEPVYGCRHRYANYTYGQVPAPTSSLFANCLHNVGAH